MRWGLLASRVNSPQTADSGSRFCCLRSAVCGLDQPPFLALTASVNLGRILCRSPTTPRSLNSKIGALGSLLIARMFSELCIPTLCWIAPEIPAEGMCELLGKVEVRRFAKPAAATNEDVGILDVDVAAALLAARHHLRLRR